MLKGILGKDDVERSFLAFNAIDDVVLLVNHMDGLSVQELYGVVGETLTRIEKSCYRSCSSVLRNILRFPSLPPDFPLRVLNLSLVAEFISSNLELLELADAPHNAVAWPAHPHYPIFDKSGEPTSSSESLIFLPRRNLFIVVDQKSLRIQGCWLKLFRLVPRLYSSLSLT
ncbi:hypothetical protein DL96DRAFT_1210520 [Flagelloscypha sp. PMI_526]|nr:hypothetical protein DL96DRAFT_1210520 [Flagelloscypha sp. PMI_526]